MFGSAAVQVMVDVPPGLSVAGIAVRLPITGGWFVTATVTLPRLVPPLPSDTSQLTVYVPADSGDTQTICEPVPVIVPAVDDHA